MCFWASYIERWTIAHQSVYVRLSFGVRSHTEWLALAKTYILDSKSLVPDIPILINDAFSACNNLFYFIKLVQRLHRSEIIDVEFNDLISHL